MIASFPMLLAVVNLLPGLVDEQVDYLKQIKPIFTQRCVACHGAVKQKAGLRFLNARIVGTLGAMRADLLG